jgi:hypothetical protein
MAAMMADTKFKAGHQSRGGRRRGSRDKIETKMLEAIQKDFEEHGEEAIKICRLERPNEYLKLVASLLPKEVEQTIDGAVTHNHQIETIRRVILDPKVVTVQEPVRLLSKAPSLEPEPKADYKGLYE